MRRTFSLETLPELDRGAFSKAAQIEIDKVITDIDRRPLDDRKRTVTITMEFLPQLNRSTGKVENVEFAFKTGSKLPGQEGTSLLRMLPKKGDNDTPELIFAAESPEDPNQLAFSDEAPNVDTATGEVLPPLRVANAQ